MHPFAQYSQYLESLYLESKLNGFNSDRTRAIKLSLDGQPNRLLELCVDLNIRRDSGAFFTGSRLRADLLEPFLQQISTGRMRAIDPACGAGDLLLEYAKYLPTRETLSETIEFWSTLLAGFDIHKQFVETAKVRLLLLAMSRTRAFDFCLDSLNDSLQKIRTSNFLNQKSKSIDADIILINPPFQLVSTGTRFKWGKGLASNAAVFVDRCITKSNFGTKIAAILPDVLRTGSRYVKWREMVQKYCQIDGIQIDGRFSTLADVDVFRLYLTVGAPHISAGTDWWRIGKQASSRIKKTREAFEVHVGPVVPHRHPRKGTLLPYLDTRCTPPGKVLKKLSKTRRFQGRTFCPPFVVLRRTSNPSDSNRLQPSLVPRGGPTAIENHLLVMLPKSGLIKDCRALMSFLKSEQARNWINTRIRCRHLTTVAVGDLPLPKRLFKP